MNIYNATKPFKVQWFDKFEEPNIYKKSYFDFLHEKAVLYSGLGLKKLDGGKFELSEVSWNIGSLPNRAKISWNGE